MAERCPYLTLAGSQCKRSIGWRMSPEFDRAGCKHHVTVAVRAQLRRHTPTLLIEISTGRMVKVAIDKPVIRRRAFELPTTVPSAVKALDQVQTFPEWSAIHRAFIGKWKLHDPLYEALAFAGDRLRRTSSDEDLAAYTGRLKATG